MYWKHHTESVKKIRNKPMTRSEAYKIINESDVIENQTTNPEQYEALHILLTEHELIDELISYADDMHLCQMPYSEMSNFEGYTLDKIKKIKGLGSISVYNRQYDSEKINKDIVGKTGNERE